MNKKISRSEFLTFILGNSYALILSTSALGSYYRSSKNGYNIKPKYENNFHDYFPSQNPELVQDFVLASHGNEGKVKELLKAHPELAKSSWDWGYGDWETALGAASHTGNKQIAEILITHGARPDIFTFAMLGNLNAVKAIIDGNQGVQKVLGPHGITLLAHAKVRLSLKNLQADDRLIAQTMVDYLSSVGDTDIKPLNLPITDEEKKQFTGKFSFGNNSIDVFLVEISKTGSLVIKKEGQKFERQLLRVNQNSFAPIGAPSVEIIFEVNKDKNATILTIHDPALIVKATRI